MIGCLFIPDFPVAVERQLQPALCDVPLALTHVTRGSPRIYAASAEAKAQGVEAGMTLAQARLHCEALRILPANLPRYQRFLEDMVISLTDFASHLEPVRLKGTQPHGLIYIRLGKLRLDDARFIGARLLRHVTETWGFAAQLGAAQSKFTAMVAALRATPSAGGPTIISPEQEAAYLAPLPLEWLPMSRKLCQSLHMVGIHSLGGFAALPSGAVLDRYGKWGTLMQQLAQGRDARRVIPMKGMEREQESYPFEPPVTNRAILDNVWSTMTETLASRLQAKGMGCQSITLILTTQENLQTERTLHLSQPVSHADRLHWLGRYLLSTMQVDSAVVQLQVVLSELSTPIPKQLSLFPEEQTDETFDDVVIHLGTRYGLEACGQITPLHPTGASPELRYAVTPIIREAMAGA